MSRRSLIINRNHSLDREPIGQRQPKRCVEDKG